MSCIFTVSPGEAGSAPRGKMTCPRSHSQGEGRAVTQTRPPDCWSHVLAVAGVKMCSLGAFSLEVSAALWGSRLEAFRLTVGVKAIAADCQP